jgi:hypothetical protein
MRRVFLVCDINDENIFWTFSSSRNDYSCTNDYDLIWIYDNLKLRTVLIRLSGTLRSDARVSTGTFNVEITSVSDYQVQS